MSKGNFSVKVQFWISEDMKKDIEEFLKDERGIEAFNFEDKTEMWRASMTLMIFLMQGGFYVDYKAIMGFNKYNAGSNFYSRISNRDK